MPRIPDAEIERIKREVDLVALVQSKGIEAAPFVARIRLDDAALADSLPAGSTGTAAIFTDRVRAAHVIRKVLLRQIAITNYVNPF